MRPTLSTFTRSVYPPASNKPTAASFALVRDILTERRQHFREILANGAVRGAGENAAASSSQAAGSSKSALNTKPFKPRASGADKKKGKSKVGGEFVEVQLPNGHPFISGNFLKNRVMPTLASLGLITKSWTKPTADTDLARHFGPERLHVMWELAPSTPATEARWAELTKEGVNGGTMAAIAREKRSTDDAAALEEKYAKFARGELVPTAREMAAWPGRPAGFTTHLERLHLNTRRKRARDGKEVRRAELVAEQKAAADAAKEALEAQP